MAGSVFKMRDAERPPVNSAAPLLAEQDGYVLSEPETLVLSQLNFMHLLRGALRTAVRIGPTGDR